MAIIGVMGSGTTEWPELAAPLGAWIAQQGHDLLTGAGHGVMLCCARAFALTPGRTGRSIGVVPTEPDPVRGFAPCAGYPNPYIDLPLLTPLPRKEADSPDTALNRNYVNILTSDVVIALPGSRGTLDEIRLAVRFGKPLMCVGPHTAFAAVPAGTLIGTQLEEVYRFVLAHTRTPSTLAAR